MHDVCLCLASDISLRAASIQASSPVSLRALRSRGCKLIGFGETLRLLCACVRVCALRACARGHSAVWAVLQRMIIVERAVSTHEITRVWCCVCVRDGRMLRGS